ncbi:hypothetical protein [Flavobacterium selenitireducens]|uniref:hypothetical protein n=1 Tax=Flavobacterium selenitireducens TaxID=2722704 RepID=UPI00168BF14F|nr:hypothetical protein [Flavobacterium selenitireducens]MBD3584073.1 hypothetical protein [Flavobacterium selenitireducens]
MIKIQKLQPYDGELKKLYKDLGETIFDESGRGAILIATAHIDEYLTKLIEANLPNTISKKERDRLFKYPGAISSFSSKIELSYCFRLIEKELYDSLNTLRRLRNDAAHSSSKFDLYELNEKMKLVYKFNPHIYDFIQKTSRNQIVKSKIAAIEKALKETLPQIDNDINPEEYLNKPENQQIIEEQLPYWEMLNGLCLICSIIVYKAETIKEILKDIETWDDLKQD